MSDPYLAEDPFSDDPDDLDMFEQQQRQANWQVINGFDADPKKAARAQQLAQVSGESPAVVYGNLEEFDRQYRTLLTSQILNSNPHLRDYAMASPINAKVSNDDWGTLDAVVAVTKKLPTLPLGLPMQGNLSILDKALEGFRHGFAAERQQEEYTKLGEYLATTPGFGNLFIRHAAQATAGVVAAGLHTLSGVAAGLSTGVGEYAKQVGVSEAWANRLTRDAYVALNVAMPELALGTGPLAMTARAFGDRIAPYVAADKTPPPGVHPISDAIHTEQAALDLKNLQEALKESLNSTTREVAPDNFASLVRQVTDGEIGVSADAIRALYKDKVPLPEDGILGWVPRLQEQLRAAEKTGGYVQIPIAEWLAKVDPAVAKQLEEHIKARPDGVSVAEGARLAEMPEGITAWHGSIAEFEAFSGEKFRTGEGAMVKGAGHYLAEQPDVATTYAKAGVQWVDKDGNKLPTGNLYKVRIKRPKEEFIDLDAPINRADPRLAAAFDEARMDLTGVTDMEDAYRQLSTKMGSDIKASKLLAKHGIPGFKYLDQGSRTAALKHNAADIARIENALKDIDSELAKGPNAELQAIRNATAAELKKYEPTSNYVVFSDADLQILDRNGEAVQAVREAAGLKPPPEIPERIIFPAVQIEGKIYTGSFHPDAFEKAAKELGVSTDELAARVGKTEDVFQGEKAFIGGTDIDGFVTSHGRYVTREEAAKIANREGQVEPGLGRPESLAADQLKPWTEADTTRAKQLELALPDMTPMDQRQAFAEASAVGMTVAGYKRWQKAMKEQAAADFADSNKRILADERKRQGAAWKAEREEMRPEVRDEIRDQPDFAAERLLREGKLYDADMGKVKIHPDYLTKEQRRTLPSTYISKRDGVSPTELAAYTGHADGEAFLAGLETVINSKRASGMRMEDFHKSIIDAELDRRMEAKHGVLDKNIIEAAKERVLADTQIQMLHEETYARAAKTGITFEFTKEEYQYTLRRDFDDLIMKHVKSDKFLADAGRAGREVEMALLKGDAQAAFLQKQRQYDAVSFAKFAKEIEKANLELDSTASPYNAREVKAVSRPTSLYIQALLQDAGYKVRLLPEEIAREIQADGGGPLSNYVERRFGDGHETVMADWILNEGAKPVEQMTTKEFLQYKDAIDILDYTGREDKKVKVLEDKRNLDTFVAEQVLPNIESRPLRDLKRGPGASPEGSWFYGAVAPMLRAETIIKALDLQKELGPLYSAVIQPIEAAKAKSYKYLESLSTSLNDFNKDLGNKWYKTLQDKIPNDFIFDVRSQAMFDLTRWNMTKMMLNWGNKENAAKLVDGIARAQIKRGVTPAPEHLAMVEARIEEMFKTHAKPEDWKYVKWVWDQFESYKPDIEQLQRNISGKPPKWVEGRPVETPIGTLEGRYFPLIKDTARNVGSAVETPTSLSGMLGKDYHRATTNQYHLEERTGTKYFVDIDNGPEQLIGRLQQVIHDLSFREAVMNAHKIMKHPDIAAAIKNHYGKEYYAQFDPWIERMARAYNVSDGWLAEANNFMGRFRQNLVMSALPLNPSVMLTPSLGTANPKLIWTALQSITYGAVGQTPHIRKVVFEHSKEVPNLLYSLDRDATEAMARVAEGKRWSTFQKKAMEWFFKPLVWMEQQTRMTTFYDVFNDMKEKGKTDLEAAAWADGQVRTRHGVSHFADLSNLMSDKNEFIRYPTMFMGYFSTLTNWVHEVPDRVRQGQLKEAGKVMWGVFGVAAIYNAAIFTKSKQDEPWYKFLARAVATTPFSMVPYMRDYWGWATEGHQPRTPLVSLFQSTHNVIKDGYNVVTGAKTPKRPVRNAAELIGQAKGVPGALQIGRWGEFAHDVATGEQRPRNIIEWSRGLLWGESQLKK